MHNIPHSKESKKKMSESHHGCIAWNKGKKMSEDFRQKCRDRQGNVFGGIRKNWKGKQRKQFSEEHKKKIGLSAKGRILSNKTRKKISIALKGTKSYLWKGGITSENKKIRNGIEFRLWREAVFARDNWTCQKTKIKGEKLQAHHIQNFAQFPELRTSIENGITLSEKAHKEFHKIYGKKNNTIEQLEEFFEKLEK